MHSFALPYFATTNGNDYMSTHIEYVEFVQPLLNMDQMAALLYCAQDFLWQDAHDKIEEEKRPQPKTLLTKPCGTETIFLVLSLLTPDKTMPYNWFPSLFCKHSARVDKFLVTDHYIYNDGEVDETQSFTETVPCRGFEMRPYNKICSLLLDTIFFNRGELFNGSESAIERYGPQMESDRTMQRVHSKAPFRPQRNLLNECHQWFADGTLARVPYFEYNTIPTVPICDSDEFIASYQGEDTLHVLYQQHLDRRFHPKGPPEMREVVFNLAYMWLKFIETKKKSHDMFEVHFDELTRVRMGSRAAKRIRDGKEKEKD